MVYHVDAVACSARKVTRFFMAEFGVSPPRPLPCPERGPDGLFVAGLFYEDHSEMSCDSESDSESDEQTGCSSNGEETEGEGVSPQTSSGRTLELSQTCTGATEVDPTPVLDMQPSTSMDMECRSRAGVASTSVAPVDDVTPVCDPLSQVSVEEVLTGIMENLVDTTKNNHLSVEGNRSAADPLFPSVAGAGLDWVDCSGVDAEIEFHRHGMMYHALLHKKLQKNKIDK